MPLSSLYYLHVYAPNVAQCAPNVAQCAPNVAQCLQRDRLVIPCVIKNDVIKRQTSWAKMTSTRQANNTGVPNDKKKN